MLDMMYTYIRKDLGKTVSWSEPHQ